MEDELMSYVFGGIKNVVENGRLIKSTRISLRLESKIEAGSFINLMRVVIRVYTMFNPQNTPGPQAVNVSLIFNKLLSIINYYNVGAS